MIPEMRWLDDLVESGVLTLLLQRENKRTIVPGKTVSTSFNFDRYLPHRKPESFGSRARSQEGCRRAESRLDG